MELLKIFGSYLYAGVDPRGHLDVKVSFGVRSTDRAGAGFIRRSWYLDVHYAQPICPQRPADWPVKLFRVPPYAYVARPGGGNISALIGQSYDVLSMAKASTGTVNSAV